MSLCERITEHKIEEKNESVLSFLSAETGEMNVN